MYPEFDNDIKKFNDLYKLESNEKPTILDVQRIRNFKDIIAEEVDEGEDIYKKYAQMKKDPTLSSKELNEEILTDMSDWLGDLIVYCASEAKRWGIPLNKVLNIIMQSNFSKLDDEGNPIYDSRGKVMKGTSYWKPEPKIKVSLQEELAH